MNKLPRKNMQDLVEELHGTGTLSNERIRGAFLAIDRKDFVPEAYEKEAYANYPLPIDHGQTISQPYTVAFMLELLDLRPGNRVMDAGSGSGWQTALLAHIVGESGKVYALEVLSEVAEFGRKNIEKYGFITNGIVECRTQNARDGLPGRAPFDRIIAAASMKEIPRAWKEQLRVGGRIVAPVGDEIHLLIKKDDETFETRTYPGFLFVPFV